MVPEHGGYWLDEDGSATVDWAVLTAALVGLGIVASASVITGLGGLSGETRDTLSQVPVGPDFGARPRGPRATARLVGLVNGQMDSDQAAGTWSLGTMAGWSNTGSGGQIETWGNGFLGVETSDGSSFVELDATRNGIDHLSTIVDLEDGVAYVLTFESAARSGSGEGDSFEVVVNGEVVATITPEATGIFSESSVVIYGQPGEDEIGFRELDGENNSVGVLLNGVEISEQ